MTCREGSTIHGVFKFLLCFLSDSAVRCRDFCDRVNVPVKDFSPHLQKTTWESRNGMHLRWPSCLRRPAQVPNTMDFQGRLCKYVLSLRSFWKPFFHVMQKSAWVRWSKVFSGRGFFLYFLVDSPPERLCPEPDACSGNVLPSTWYWLLENKLWAMG